MRYGMVPYCMVEKNMPLLSKGYLFVLTDAVMSGRVEGVYNGRLGDPAKIRKNRT